MHMVENRTTGIKGQFNLPRTSGIAYPVQETWVLNDTIEASRF